VRQAFSLQPLLVGGNPLTTTAIYGLIHAMERRGGIWFAKGGTGQLIRQLVNLATRQGVRFHFGCRVVGFTTDPDSRLTSVSYVHDSQRRSIGCDLGVWGGDPQVAYGLLGAERLSLTERARSKTVTSSMGLYVLYFRTKRHYQDVAHHTIILSERWEGLLKDIFGGKKLPFDPSLYLHRPATTDRDLEREEGDSFYVLAPVPHLGLFNSWQQSSEHFKEVVLKILEERVLPDVRGELLFAEAVDPRYFKDTLHSPLGAGFSIAPILSQSAWFRFHNQSDKVRNLYLCGAGVHPGGGLPGVVTSAKVVERLVQRDFASFCSTEPHVYEVSKEIAS